jgi:hypothetical protein
MRVDTQNDDWDDALKPFLYAETEAQSDLKLGFLQHEFITLIISSPLAYELRRGPTVSLNRIWADTEAFREIQATVEGKIAIRLRRLRNAVQRRNNQEKPITDFSGMSVHLRDMVARTT